MHRHTSLWYNESMNKDLTLARTTLAAKKLTLCIAQNGEIVARDTAHGVVPLARLCLHGQIGAYKNAALADRITGRAAAILLASLGISAVHTGVLSQAAVPVLQAADIDFSYDIMAEGIKNRVGDALCPMEALAAPLGIGDADKLLQGIQTFFEKQGVII